ncbi:hypothetical protein [Lysinibacillus xylanilyticus]|uniref:hypothetical protein n=1 Tax=Lysinibacillus xylanilyticus TaxID=582475 RepID=UPI00382D8CAB
MRESVAAATCLSLCESEATAKGFYLHESKATAATQHRCRSVSRYRMDAMILG